MMIYCYYFLSPTILHRRLIDWLMSSLEICLWFRTLHALIDFPYSTKQSMKNERKSLTGNMVCACSMRPCLLSMKIGTIKCIYIGIVIGCDKDEYIWMALTGLLGYLMSRASADVTTAYSIFFSNGTLPAISGCISGNVLLSLAHVNSSGIWSPLYEFGEWCQLCCVSSRPLCAL